MLSLAQKIDQLIEEKSLLKHPFYQLWSDGKLSIAMLAGYAKEYFQMVKAVPTFVNDIIAFAPSEMVDGLRKNQAEEAEHIALWVNFATALGLSKAEVIEYEGLEPTNEAVEELSVLMDSLRGGAVAMYAFEKDIPRVSRTKVEGLKAFYGITSEQGTEYFNLHMEADIRHAAAWQSILDTIPEEEHETMLRIAEQSLDVQNHLLDSCLEGYCKNAA